jgi:hypothetical protein
VRVARLAAEQWGVVDLAELRALGLSERAVLGRVRAGRLHRVHHGVYAVGHPALPLEGRFLAAVKACGPGAVLSHHAAAALHGVLDPEDRRVEVTVTGTGGRARPGLLVHRTHTLGPRDVGRCAGIPCTSPARTLLDLAARLDRRALRSAVRRAQALQRVNVRELLEVLERRRPCRGAARLARVLATGPAPTRSVLEDVVLDLVLAAGLAPPDVNVPLRLAGRRVVPDFRWPAARLVVEADGAAWHDERLAREDDAERQALLEAHGERVLRVTWRQAVGRPAETIARLRAAGAPSVEEPTPAVGSPTLGATRSRAGRSSPAGRPG